MPDRDRQLGPDQLGARSPDRVGAGRLRPLRACRGRSLVTAGDLTIQNFHPSQGGGAVNGNGNNGWTEKYNLMKGNSPGAAMMLGGDNVVSSNCLTANGEYGFNGYSYVDQTSAYPKWTVCNNISNNQNNHFTNNTYAGPWTFVYFNQGDTVGASAWQAGVNDVEGSGYSFKGQDQGSSP